MLFSKRLSAMYARELRTMIAPPAPLPEVQLARLLVSQLSRSVTPTSQISLGSLLGTAFAFWAKIAPPSASVRLFSNRESTTSAVALP